MEEKKGRNKRKSDQLSQASEILESISDGVFALDPDWRFTYLNKQAASNLGFQPEDIIGQYIWEKFPQFRGGELELNFRKVMATGQPQELEIQGPITKQWHKVKVYPLAKGISVNWRDITERKNAEEALKESEERHRAFFENSIDALLITSPDGSIHAANDEACRMFGMTKQELKQAGRDGVVDKSDPRLISALEERARTGKFKGELRFKRKDGTIFPCEISNAFFTDRNGKTLIAQVNRDITQRKQSEEVLAKTKDELEIRVKERTQQLQKAFYKILQTQKAIREANKQLKQYGRRITQVQEEERKRIAFELHDDTAQYLGILKMQLNALLQSDKIQSPEVLDKLKYLEKDADRAFNDVRSYSHELRPSVLDHMGLRSSLEQAAEDFNSINIFKVEVEVEGKEPELSEEVKLGFFRIAQEALNNIRKHAKADKATIQLQFQNKHLSMKVIDDGIGFDSQEVKNRSGKKAAWGY